MFRSRTARYGWFSVLSLSAAILSACNDRTEATPEQIAQFKYCSGFTAAAERGAYHRLVDLATVGSLRAQQMDAAQVLLLQPQEMAAGVPVTKADAPGNVPTTATTEVGRGMAEGQAMIDKNQQKELAETIQKCSDLFATLVK